jgi:hypothetical protein
MAIFGKRSGQDAREKSVDPDELRRSVDEGLLIAKSAVTVAVANRIILNALQRDEQFDADEVAGQTREELERMASEQAADAARMREVRAKAQKQKGRSRHQHDYRRGDDLKLRTREATYEELAEELRARKTDDAWVDGIVVAARERAWDDIGETVVGRLGWAQRPTADYEVGRDDRLRAMLDEDFAALLAEHADFVPESTDTEQPASARADHTDTDTQRADADADRAERAERRAE